MTRLIGIDVSAYQGDVDWAKAAPHIGFGVARCLRETMGSDPTFQKNWRGMKAAGIPRGAYLFMNDHESATAQAMAYLSIVAEEGGFQPGDLPPIVDFERGTKSLCQDIITEIKRQTKLPVILYSGSYLQSRGGGKLGATWLWRPGYGRATFPDEWLPDGWTRDELLFWQYCSTAANNATSYPSHVPGVPAGGLDMNVLMYKQGTVANLGDVLIKPKVRRYFVLGGAEPAPEDGFKRWRGAQQYARRQLKNLGDSVRITLRER